MEKVTREETAKLLFDHYKIDLQGLPTQREESAWEPENNLGFLLGVVNFGQDFHVVELHKLLENNQFEVEEGRLIASMIDYYIRPFHSFYTESECHTRFSSRPPSRGKPSDELDYMKENRELGHSDLKKAVFKRDGVCLFCWHLSSNEASHIIAQVSLEQDQASILQRAGLSQKHQVQNGLLLCKICSSEFNNLNRYVDIVDEKLVLKLVNETNDETSDKHKEWEDLVFELKHMRQWKQDRYQDGKKAVEPNEEMGLYFINNNPSTLPSRKALEFHKIACLIWRMAGGTESDEDYCSCDSYGPVDTYSCFEETLPNPRGWDKKLLIGI